MTTGRINQVCMPAWASNARANPAMLLSGKYLKVLQPVFNSIDEDSSIYRCSACILTLTIDCAARAKAKACAAWLLDDACTACSELALKLQTQRVWILAKNMDGPRQAQTFSLLSSYINSSARRASVKDEVSMMTKTNGVNKARFHLEQQPQPTDPAASQGPAEDNPFGCKTVFFVFLPSRFRSQ